MECAAGYNKGIWIHAAYHTNSVVDSSSQMVLIKDVHRLVLSHTTPVCVCVCVCVCVVANYALRIKGAN